MLSNVDGVFWACVYENYIVTFAEEKAISI